MSQFLRRSGFGISLLGIVVALWVGAFFWVPTESHQGEVYRILYLHVPSAFTAFFSALVLFIASILGLNKKEKALLWAKSAAEVGLLFTLLTLFTGSVWGKPTWGTWWTWDARLTTTFILGLLYVGFLMLYNTIDDHNMRQKVCSIMGVLIFADVPIIYKSVTWWRTLHQPPSLLRSEGSTMSEPIYWYLIASIGAVLMFSLWLISKRQQILELQAELEEKSYNRLRKDKAFQSQ